MDNRKWYETHDNLVGLAEWLDSECSNFIDASEAIRFFEKPWKWTREYDLWTLWTKSLSARSRGNAIDTTDFSQRCIDAVNDEKMTAEQLRAESEGETR